MPTLDVVQLEALNAARPSTCPRCGRAVRKNYCRQHDEYIETGHMLPDCPGAGHDDHRTY